MNKKGSWWILVSIIFVTLLLGVLFFYFVLFAPNNEKVYSGQEIKNPVTGLSDEQALVAFDENFVFYLLYEIETYNLHNPPLSSDIPKIEIRIGNEIYNALVEKGLIKVTKGEISNEDIVIKITKQEAVKMLRDKNYVVQSFNEGKSGIELVASKTTLFAKGYLSLYTKLTGKSITGNIIRIYSD